MKKFFLTLFLTNVVIISSFAAGHITKAQKEIAIECLGHYTATAVLPADTVEVKDIEVALAASKVIREHLNNEGIKNDEINKGMNIYVDKVYGKPFNKKKNEECNKSTYNLIPGSKEKIEKLSRTIYQG
tara:strand:- start:435 stop:821 length:387 start_codon:yes stop_codon:yes gene_type:complete